MSDFDIKQGDTLPKLIANLKNSDGTVINLTSANVFFKMKDINNGSLLINAEANVTSASLGTVQYDWVLADTDTGGEFNGEFQITFSGGSIQTVPTISYITIKIHDDLD